MRLFKTQPNPFRFLLYTEWMMLASCGLMAAIEAWQQRRIPMQHFCILLILGVMGLGLPSGKLVVRYLYTAIEIGIIFYGTTLGYLHILPTLYLIVVIRSCFLFQPIERWIVAGVCLVLFLVNQAQYFQIMSDLVVSQMQRVWMHQIAQVLMFGLSLFFVIQLVGILLNERKMQAQLTLAHHQLRQYALQIEDLAALQERNRIAREIHDSVGHALTALNIQLQTTAKLWPIDPDQAQTFLAQAQRLGITAMQEVRQSVSALRIEDRPEEPLEVAIATLVDDFRHSTGIAIDTHLAIRADLSSQITKTLHRLVQEALTNICKHAQATSVQLAIETSEDSVHLTICDNGRGFASDRTPSGYGLQGMQERVSALGGRFNLDSALGAGCQINVQLPIEVLPTMVLPT
ncbi:sensor histidine kinase [Microcoleus sp. FACHB-1515]|uniref:sensor histidine kinase n=1 Tax=Cyanophyceae TaxID=3028117 RepID=UPI001689F5C2|nr:sensor histidine kinase [Microcoleus sp. FACHB-1515]MBD2088911.1 sensor histidine kinase [Microcoleus sp. FACHB-1515]